MNQTLTITIRFKEKHEPGHEAHLTEIARSYFKGKGINLTDAIEI